MPAPVHDPHAPNLSKVTLQMAIWFGVLFSLNALCTCIMAAFVNATWEDMGSFKRFLTGIAILGNWSTVMMAFLSKTVARLESGKSLIPTNGTDMFAKAPDGTVLTVTKP